MKNFDPELADIRFGCGLSPKIAPMQSPQAMLETVLAPDTVADAFPIEDFPQFRQRMIAVQALWKKRRKNRGTEEGERLRKQTNLLKKAAREEKARWLGQSLQRRVHTDQPFRERLVYFWADHFSAQGKRGLLKRGTSPYIEASIRPHVGGRFADMLYAAVTSPLMIHYLDQELSMGPSSPKAARRGAKAGLNENLAREVLELHTLGVDGPYTQSDVRELAELFTGMSYTAKSGFKFRKDFAEPGSETVMGVTYSEKPSMEAVRDALNDLARHPVTADHLARKLAVHFVSDAPDEKMIDHMAARYRATDGSLPELYTAMIEHPSAWDTSVSNFKTPIDFVGSALRALAIKGDTFSDFTENDMKRAVMIPLASMGQVWQKPLGPDGWPEEDAEWLTPQGLSGRVRWAMGGPQMIMDDLPDPRDFVQAALGARATPEVAFAASAAESKADAIGLVLMSPAFQRR